jgi:hypothetical protein
MTQRCNEDNSLICSEENCMFSRWNPSLCFEPGEQIPEDQIPEFKPVKHNGQFNALRSSDETPSNDIEKINTLVENPSNEVEKPEVAAPGIPVTEKPAQIITENITKPEARKMPQYKEGTCSNCERGPINVHNKTGLCGSCRKACEYARNPEEREAALKAAKEKFSGKPVFREGTKRKGIVEPVNKRPGNPLLEPVKTNAQQEANRSIPSTPQEAFETVMRIVTADDDRGTDASGYTGPQVIAIPPTITSTDIVIHSMLSRIEYHLSEIKKIHGVLVTLNEYGANIEIPEVRL